MERICIVGAGGHGREIAEIVREMDPSGSSFELVGFADDSRELKGKLVMGIPVIGSVREVFIENDNPPLPVIGIGIPEIRKKIVETISPYVEKWPNIIHPSARIASSTILGNGCVVFPGCILSVDVQIGNHVHINTGSSISHDSVIGDLTIVNPGAFINGNVNVGNGFISALNSG